MTITPAEPVAVAQQTFRTLLTAMARPGTVHELVSRPGESPEEAVAFALVDHEVAFAVIGGQQTAGAASVARRITLRTGSSEAETSDAAFVFVYAPLTATIWASVRRGTLEYPDGGATVVYVLSSVGAGPLVLTLTGPGIETEQRLALAGLPASEFALRDEACGDYPMGVDCMFVDSEGHVACVPRSSKIAQIEEG